MRGGDQERESEKREQAAAKAAHGTWVKKLHECCRFVKSGCGLTEQGIRRRNAMK
jgi:hypothetical protein